MTATIDRLDAMYAELMAATNFLQAERLYAEFTAYVEDPDPNIRAIRRARALTLIAESEAEEAD